MGNRPHDTVVSTRMKVRLRSYRLPLSFTRWLEVALHDGVTAHPAFAAMAPLA